MNTKVNGAEIKGDKVTLDLETKKGDKDTLDADVVLVCAGSFLFCVMVMHDPIQAAFFASAAYCIC